MDERDPLLSLSTVRRSSCQGNRLDLVLRGKKTLLSLTATSRGRATCGVENRWEVFRPCNTTTRMLAWHDSPKLRRWSTVLLAGTVSFRPRFH